MKSKYLIFALFIVGVLSSSCEDFLNEEVKSDLSKSSFYSNAEDLKIAVNAVVMVSMKGSSIGHRQISGMLSYGDDIITTRHDANKADMRQVDQFNISPGNPKITNAWQKFYEVIHQANGVIENYTRAQGDTADIEALVSVARFYRALHYFELVRAWGDVPITTTLIESDIHRSPVKDVYAHIEADLKEAIKWLPENQGANKGYPTIWAAKTLLADVYMTMAGWPLNLGTEYYNKALVYLTDVKDNSGASLEPVYADLYSYEFDESKSYIKDSEYNKEFIFQIIGVHKNILNGFQVDNGNSYVDALFWKGWSDIVAEISFYKRFPRDDRFKVTFNEFGQNHPSRGGTETVPWEQFITGHPTFKKKQYNWKIKFEHFRDNYRNFDVYRYTDVLLMFAEADAMAHGAPSALAYDAVNRVRERANKSKIDAGASPSDFDLTPGLPGEQFRDSVLEEVAYEFAADGTRRWFDLVRTEKVEWANGPTRKNILESNPYVYTSDKTFKADGSYVNEPYGPRNLFDLAPINAINKNRYYFPIPESEIIANGNLTQNQGY